VNSPPPAVDVLLVDDALGLVVVHKPSGVAVHRGWAPERDTMMARVRDALGHRVDPLHRLDRGTSGALALSMRREQTAYLSAPFQAHEARKTYLALVRGSFPDEVDHDHPIRLGRSHERVDAHTRFRCVARGDGCSLVSAQPVTGRLHQLRRHLKQLSHPIVGDVNYGKGDVNRRFREEFGLNRLALHAARLELSYGAATVDVRAPVPDDLGATLRALGLWPPRPDEAEVAVQWRLR
jgi:tRNA pseudouridine65 synthase